MEAPAYFTTWTFPGTGLFLALACGPDSGMVDPASRPDDGAASLSSKPYSPWSAPQNLIPVNSAATDQHPALSKDGLRLYFASNRTTGDQNIWVARRACTDIVAIGCRWSAPVMLGNAVNSGSLDAAPALSRDEHQLFFASQRSNGHCSISPTIPQCDRDLWVSYREDVHDDFWQPAVNLGAPVNTNGEEVAPSYFENDHRENDDSQNDDSENDDSGVPQLFFNDGMVNDDGVLVLGDIYVSQLSPNGTWSRPLPVGELNTPCSDQRPSVSHDGRTLYFHSTRPLTPGACATAHIWVAARQRVGDPWSAPTLVPSPISDAATIHPFIHSQGKIQTLLFVRGGDLWVSERTRVSGSQ